MKVSWFLDCYSVRTVCIRNNFYTAGNNDEYENMFSMVRKKREGGLTVEEVAEIAKDIADHTSEEVTVEYIAERLLNAAYTAVR